MSTTSTFANPISQPGQDPWVIAHGDAYLWSFARDCSIHIAESPNLHRPGPGERVWTAPRHMAACWAPELHRLRGQWLIYFAACNAPWQPGRSLHQAFVLRSATPDPRGPYELHGPLATGGWAIDMTVLELGASLFAVWSGWDEPGTDRQFLYAALMSEDGLSIVGERALLVDNDTHLWERRTPTTDERGLHEGPQVLRRGDRTFLVFSCGASWLPTYKLGLLELQGTDPLAPGSWAKLPEPLFASTERTLGVGHGCFVRAKGGEDEWWHVYHAKDRPEPGWARSVLLQPFHFRADGTPNLGSPVGRGVPMPLPSGDVPADEAGALGQCVPDAPGAAGTCATAAAALGGASANGACRAPGAAGAGESGSCAASDTLHAGRYRLVLDRGGQPTKRRFLSANEDGSRVDLWPMAGERQAWELLSEGEPGDVFSLMVHGGVRGPRRFLSSNIDGSKVDLWHAVGTHQRWRARPWGDSGGRFALELLHHVAGARAFLSANADGTVVDLWHAVGPNQLWRFEPVDEAPAV